MKIFVLVQVGSIACELSLSGCHGRTVWTDALLTDGGWEKMRQPAFGEMPAVQDMVVGFLYDFYWGDSIIQDDR